MKPKFLPVLVFVSITLYFSGLTQAQNVAPTANADIYNSGLNYVLSIDTANGILVNDTDTGGSGFLSVRTDPVSGPDSGSLVLSTDGGFTYTPNSGFVGTDQFIYSVCDDGTPGTIVSRFDFDSAPLTDATIGPDATSINPNAAQSGCGLYLSSGSGGTAGFDVVVPNAGGLFDFTSFTASFEYQDQESVADIITAGNFRIYHITGNELGIAISVINGNTGLPQTYTQKLGNFLAGNNLYNVYYDELTGTISYTVNGTLNTFTVAPAFSPLDSALATNITLGKFMDGSGSSIPSLCSVQIQDNSILCDEATVTLNIKAKLITNRQRTYRVNPD